YLGVTADVSGTSVTPFGFSALGFSAGTYQRLNNYLFGPTITANLGRSAVFAHALFGEAHSSLGAGVGIPIIGGISTGITSANAFAMAFGGGIDTGLTRQSRNTRRPCGLPPHAVQRVQRVNDRTF